MYIIIAYFQEPGETFNNNESKKANADPLEQEPDAMSDVTIVASTIAIQAKSHYY